MSENLGSLPVADPVLIAQYLSQLDVRARFLAIQDEYIHVCS